MESYLLREFLASVSVCFNPVSLIILHSPPQWYLRAASLLASCGAYLLYMYVASAQLRTKEMKDRIFRLALDGTLAGPEAQAELRDLAVHVRSISLNQK